MLADSAHEKPQHFVCILADNLFAVEPFVELILAKDWHFILTAKPERNKELFFMYDYVHEKKQFFECQGSRGHSHQYQWKINLFQLMDDKL